MQIVPVMALFVQEGIHALGTHERVLCAFVVHADVGNIVAGVLVAFGLDVS